MPNDSRQRAVEFYELAAQAHFVFLTRPFGVSMELASRHPLETVAAQCGNIEMTEFYGGFAFVAVGGRRDAKDVT
jgi:hypothetical protein